MPKPASFRLIKLDRCTSCNHIKYGICKKHDYNVYEATCGNDYDDGVCDDYE